MMNDGQKIVTGWITPAMIVTAAEQRELARRIDAALDAERDALLARVEAMDELHNEHDGRWNG